MEYSVRKDWLIAHHPCMLMEMMIHAPFKKKKKKKMQLQHMITKLPREPVLPGLSSDFQELTVTHSGPTSRCCCNCKHQFNQWLCNFITVSSSAVIISNFCSPCCRFTANICCTVAGRQQVLDHYSCVRSATGGRVGGERERESEFSVWTRTLVLYVPSKCLQATS